MFKNEYMHAHIERCGFTQMKHPFKVGVLGFIISDVRGNDIDNFRFPTL